jgi:predicted phage terminase large subunit-like protein
MMTDEYKEFFPSTNSRLPSVSSNDKWSTLARTALNDSQHSFNALGPNTGFVGAGADLLLIDDPYASPQEAHSEAGRTNIWTFWKQSAKPRLHAESNVIVLFHRYHTDDLAGRLEQDGIEDGRPWRIFRFAAEGDGQPNDPMKRKEGELLSPRLTRSFIEEIKKDPTVWMGQFQGHPLPPGGGMFKEQWFTDNTVEGIPLNADGSLATVRRLRRWDVASTDGGGDYTVGTLFAESNGVYYIEDMVRGQWEPAERDRRIASTTHTDRATYGDGVQTILPEDPGAAGKSQGLAFVKLLAGFHVSLERESGSKIVRAGPLASQMAVGNVKIIRADWNAPMMSELCAFPYGLHDDIVDTCSGALNYLAENSNEYQVYSLR